MTKQLIINADDLGICRAANRAIAWAAGEGVVTSASLMANMPAFDDAIRHVLRPNPRLGVGAHLCLTSGRPVLPPRRVPLLVDAAGRLRLGFFGLWRLVRSRRREETVAQIAAELYAQAERIEARGIAIDHVDSHQHVHLIPGVWEIAARIAVSCRAAIRVPDERWVVSGRSLLLLPLRIAGAGFAKQAILSGLARRLRGPDLPVHADRYCGVLDSGRLTRRAWRSLLDGLRDGVTEVNAHPAFALGANESLDCSRADARFLDSPNRFAELIAVVGPWLRHELAKRDVRLTTFAELSESRREQLRSVDFSPHERKSDSRGLKSTLPIAGRRADARPISRAA